MIKEKSEMEGKILASHLDQVTKVRLFQILDRGPTESEVFLIRSILGCEERYKKPQIAIDSDIRGEFNQP